MEKVEVQEIMHLKDRRAAKRKRIFDIIVNVLSVPLVFITICLSFSIIIGRINRTTPSFAGRSMVVISSPSMVNSGFNVGDVKIIKKVNTKSLKKGDIVAYYRHNTLLVETVRTKPEYLKSSQYSEKTNTTLTEFFGFPTEEFKDAGARNSIIVIHEIIDIREDSKGNLYFQTKGSSNNSADDYYFTEDYIVGKYVESKNPIIALFSFLYAKNMFVLILIIPIIIITLVAAYNILQSLYCALLENEVVEKKRKLDDSECVRHDIGYKMAPKTKYQVLAFSTPEERLYYLPLLWKKAERSANIQKYYLKKKIYVNKYEKVNALKHECALMIKNGKSEESVTKYYEKEVAKLDKEIEEYKQQLRLANIRTQKINKIKENKKQK